MTVLAVALAALLQSTTPMRAVDKGSQSGIRTARQAVIRTDAEWTELWRAHAPRRPEPEIDFSKEMVLGVFLGTRPTAGFAVEITGVHEEGGELTVEYRESRPPRGSITAQILTSPFHVVAVPRTAGPVTFKQIQ
jgi:hypothetical protein